ncbi:hypothetical protein PybrP1_012307 [[Pythium] brassicae (nom. inval.)]|nr:hypothetical protein PybrP1_012307 [[Pythium] brassicae (nom. inval.)]
MESRNTRSYREFVHSLLHVDGLKGAYAGVLCLDAHGAVAFADGAFHAEPHAPSRHLVRVALPSDESDDLEDSDALLDTRQFLRVFETHDTARHLQLHALHVGDTRFQVVGASFTSASAVASGRRHALAVERLPFGVLVVVASYPQALERVLPLVGAQCARARR